jgi:lipoate-protein ligase B
MHGFALNVASDLSGFLSIIPCGISGVQMTSISKESGAEISLETVRDKLFPYLRRSLDAGAFALPPQGGNVA